jgi:DNA repair exonuclease SbcCD ATPase subunit
MSESKPPLTIVALETENVLKIRSLHVEPKPSGLIIVGGDNGAGKTSTIDSIWFALGGKPNAKFPIHEGEKEGKVTLDLGDLTVVRRFRYKENGELASDLKITNKDGATYNSPQKMLDGLITKIAFDPFEFAELEAKKQVDAFRAALGIDTTELDKEEKQAVEDRQLVKRELQTILARNQGMPEYEDVPDEPVSAEALSVKLREANEHNADITDREQKIAAAKDVLTAMDGRIKEEEENVERLRAALAAAEAKLEEYQTKRAEREAMILTAEEAIVNRAKIDTSEIEKEFAEIAETNRKVAANKALREARVEFEAKDEERVTLELKVDEIRAARKKLIEDAVRNAEFAVGGIDVREDGLYLGDLPFAQANTAERLKFSVALALKQNPRLRVFRIADGEKIMPKNLEILERIAVEAGAQIWVEHAMTREDVEGGFRTPTIFIENGQVTEVTKAGGN